MPQYILKLDYRNHKKPNPAWIKCLQDTYASFGIRGRQHPWNKQETIDLGILYYRSWDMLPTSTRMDRAYCLPDATTIRRLFGTYHAYYGAILAACSLEVTDAAITS